MLGIIKVWGRRNDDWYSDMNALDGNPLRYGSRLVLKVNLWSTTG